MAKPEIALEPELYEQARREAERQGISLSELVQKILRDALKEAVEDLQKPWMRYAGIFDSGDPDASQTVDEVVYNREKP